MLAHASLRDFNLKFICIGMVMEVTRNYIRESGIDDARNRNFSDNVWNLKNTGFWKVFLKSAISKYSL
jgi:hypothetical protein